MAKKSPARKQKTEQETRPMISDGIGASDDSSGGGNAAGSPDADTAMRGDTANIINKGDVEADRQRLFPGSGKKRSAKKND